MRTADLADQLRQALERSELLVLYQPHHDLSAEQRLLGFEALVRWQHPERGMILPAEFIPLADEIGLLSTIGQFVLGQSLELLARLQATRSDLTLSINVSRNELSAPRSPPRSPRSAPRDSSPVPSASTSRRRPSARSRMWCSTPRAC